MKPKTTTIRISENLKNNLDTMGAKTDTYEDIIKRNIQFVEKFANETQFGKWFEENFLLLGFDSIKLKNLNSFPDYVMLKDGKDVRVELETISSNFIAHRHDPEKVDLVICLLNNTDLPVHTIEIEPFEYVRGTTSVSIDKETVPLFNELRAKETGRRGVIISQQEFLHFLISLYKVVAEHDVTILEEAQKRAEERKE